MRVTPQQCLNLRPLPHAQGSLRPGFMNAAKYTRAAFAERDRLLHPGTRRRMGVHLIMLLSALVSVAYRGARVVVSLASLADGASPLVLGLIAAATVAAPTLLAVRAGKVADRHGPRMPMLLGSLGLAIAL